MFESTRKRVRVRAWRGRRDAPTVVAMTSRAPAPAARVLLTGFEPFGGDVHNPSIAAARAASTSSTSMTGASSARCHASAPITWMRYG